jgi:hypothetical protein
MRNPPFLFLALLSLCGAGGRLSRAGHSREDPPVEWTDLAQFVRSAGRYETYTSSLETGNAPVVAGVRLLTQKANPNCREWRDEVCTLCGIESAIDISVKNKTKTPVLFCRDMKPGPARVVMTTHAEPTIPGLWEVEFGLGYQTSARNECPHQFVASNNPPLKPAYEVGPITIEGEIPPDGKIQASACVGLSSARVGEEGKETGASLRVFKLRVASE